jgi:hypothetical protein
LCRFWAFSLARSAGASTVRKGNAHGRELQGKGTITIILIHFSPKHFTQLF